MTRRNKKSGLDQLLAAPWWVSAILALVAYSTSHWIIPSIWANNPITKAMGDGFKPVGTAVSIVLALIAVALFFRQQLKRVTSLNSADSKQSHFVAPTAAPWVTDPASAAQAWDSLVKESHSAPHTCRTTKWSIAILRQIEWKRIEELTAAYFRENGVRAETIRAGADGGVDVRLFAMNAPNPGAIVQCKAWNTQRVGVKPVRELLGVMVHEGIPKGYFLTTGGYTDEAIEFAKGKAIILITGEMFLEKILALSDEAQQRLLALATKGDYTTPTCPSCGIKMVRRTSSRGAFWGCSNYPGCRQKFSMKARA